MSGSSALQALEPNLKPVVVAHASTCVEPNLSQIWKLPVYGARKNMKHANTWRTLCLTLTEQCLWPVKHVWRTQLTASWGWVQVPFGHLNPTSRRAVVAHASTCVEPNLSQIWKLPVYGTSKKKIKTTSLDDPSRGKISDFCLHFSPEHKKFPGKIKFWKKNQKFG